MKLGLALSGGGVKGAAHIGVIKALEEENIEIDVITGTSSGSIVSALYAMGYTTKEIRDLFDEFAKVLIETNPKYFISHVKQNKSFLPEGTRSGENIELAVNQVAEYKKITKINQIKMPIAIPAVDVVLGKEFVFTNNDKDEDYYLKDVEISKAVRASCSFPGIYAPCVYEGHPFLDGGILDNIPVKEAKKLGADRVIAIKFEAEKMNQRSNIYSILLRTLDVMTNRIADENLKESDYILELPIEKVGLLDISKIEECYQIGYQKTKELMPKIKEIIGI